VGFHHGCFINDGKVHCWGSNSVGQITGTFGGTYSWLAPTEVTLAAPATKVTAGIEHTCALLTDSSIWCWGENRQGQLGNGTKVMPAPPTKVIGLPAKVLDVEAGLSLGCAYLEDNSIWCWGDGAVGITQTATPIKLGTVADVARMKVEYGIYLVNKTGGLFRQLTSGSFGPLTEFGADIVQIASGQYHTCALRRDGTVGCKGNNSSGQLGNGSISNSDIVVEAWKLGKNNVEIVCGRYLTCARDQWGAVLCAGDKSGSTSTGRLKLACP